MGQQSRPENMSDIEWLVALEEIRQLKARRDRYLDAHDWDAYEALHAPDHVSRHPPDPVNKTQSEGWSSPAEVTRKTREIMARLGNTAVHHSYDPEIVFDTPTKARSIWAMTSASIFKDAEGKPGWRINYGYYYEGFERRDGRWLFTFREWRRHFSTGSEGVIYPVAPVEGSNAFAEWAE